MISFIVPTVGRESLTATLNSIELRDEDEIIVVGAVHDGDFGEQVHFIHCGLGHDWGAKERTLGIQRARGSHLAFIDDDDTYLPGARDAMERALRAAAGRPTLFRMRYPNGKILWHDPVLRCGNVSTQMVLVPNNPLRLGTWSGRREGDFDFLSSMHWSEDEIVFDPEIIALLGHDDD